MEKTRDKLIEEHETSIFKKIYGGSMIQKKLDEILKKGKYDQYFIICRETNLSPKEEVIKAFPEKYKLYFGNYKLNIGDNSPEVPIPKGIVRKIEENSEKSEKKLVKSLDVLKIKEAFLEAGIKYPFR